MRSSSRLLRAVMSISMVLALAACQGAANPSPSVVADPTPTPPPPSADDIIARFLTLTGNPVLTMHVVADGKVTVRAGGATDDVKVGFDMDISGADGVGNAVVDTGPSDTTFKMLLVQNHAYVDDNGTWTEVPDYRPSAPLNPFAGLTGRADVSYRGHEIRDGHRVHHLSVLVWLGGDLSLLQGQGWTNVKVDYTLTTLTVDDAGAPIHMDFSGGISGRYQDVSASAAFEIAYDFTKIGQPVDIPTPA
ncbi:MAG TPA: hypothetical protein VL687_06490 [Methylomirabilota bacterium]|nr:hypothetical protein [Methylomirabilota bacterium]